MSSARTHLLAAIFLIAHMAVSLNAAQAQAPDLSTDEVTVDLSVIDNPGAAPASVPYMAASPASTPRLGLMLPGAKTPISKLHVAVPKATGRIKLRKPGSKPRKTARRSSKKTKKKARIKRAKIAKPAPPTIAATKPPAPLKSAPPAAPVAAPAPVKQKTAKTAKPAVKMPEKPKAAPPPAPVAKAVKKPEAAPAPKEQAALPPAPETTGTGKTLRVEFKPAASKFPATAKKGLQALAKKLKGKNNLRLQLMAYAGGKSLSASKARRMSLSRALSVRSFLIVSGVHSARIDVRALGSKTTEKPLNRVDVNIVER
jgi:outer membrane protein OmpA-like peptidoglycan-associated protein